jgi:hypothetical protein
MSARTSAVRIGLVYPELLCTYGDRGNAIVLTNRLKWRGIDADLVECPAGEPLPDSLDVYCIGGGEDAPQALAAEGLRSSANALQRARDNGSAVLAVCAGFQLIGTTYTDADGIVTLTGTAPPGVKAIRINGIDMIEWNEAGLITHFKVMVRPLKGMNMLHQKMGEMLQQMTG